MTQFSKIFQKQPVEVPKFSGFDLSHINIGSLKVGTLTPVLTEPVVPNDNFSLGLNANFQLPPMATDFIGKVDVRFEAYFVPYRILWQGYKHWYNNLNVDEYTTPVTRMPKINLHTSAAVEKKALLGPGTLADYLGIKLQSESLIDGDKNYYIPNPLPFLAYHMIWDRWYRDKLVQRPLFMTPDEVQNMVTNSSSPFFNDNLESFCAAMMPYRFGPLGMNSEFFCWNDGAEFDDSFEYNQFRFADGSHLFQLRQRNWAKDYFSVATPEPQAGNQVSLEFTLGPGSAGVDAIHQDGSRGTFSIAALRAANTLQKFAEKRNIAGSEYDSQILADWGIKPADSVIQHPILLGSQSINVYNRTIMQTANGAAESSAERPRNPFDSTVGASFGKSSALGSGSIVDSFKVREPGIIMVLASLVPHAFYSTGTRRYLMYNEFTDFPNPNFVAIGDQPIYQGELASESFFSANNREDVFGYSQRYCELKFHNDEVHGLLRDGENLDHFAIQRSFYTQELPTISSSFLRIEQNAMDNVTAVADTLSEYGAWYEIAFQEHIVRAFPEYSIPTLGDEKHTRTIMMDKGGKRL